MCFSIRNSEGNRPVHGTQESIPDPRRGHGAHLVKASIQRCLLLGVIVLAQAGVRAAGQEADLGWPRMLQSNGEEIQIYQPQAEKWEGGKLEGRAAVIFTERTAGRSVYGVVWLVARTTLDQEKRLVTLYDIEVRNAAFPSARAQESTYVAKATKALPQWTMTIALDRLLADLAITQTEGKTGDEALNTAPPKIFFRQSPAVLILIDGQPVLRKVPDTNFMRVINSPAVLVLESGTGRYFLHGDGYWMTALDLQGPWSRSGNPPKSLAALLPADEQADRPPAANAASSSGGPPPEVIVSMEPAELILCTGEAQFTPIGGTQLLYVKNTDGDLFLSLPQQRYYVLLSGRWFTAHKLDGPWEFVAGSALPGDFARIPTGHPKGAVLASVPGTVQARDAVIAAQVPQTATVDRRKTTFSATYDGDPQFKPIEGTDMMYAVNSPNDIIFVGGKYYAVSDGVWFVSESARGPWAVCDFVPPAVYSMPPASPVYHVKYVYVYDSTPDFVYVGYTPGYFGVFVWGDVVVYGTGFWYPCWCTDYWFGWPWTWGFGFHYVYWGGGFYWRPWYPHRWYWRPWIYGRGDAGWRHRRVLYNRSIETTANRIRLRNTSVYDRWRTPSVVSRRPVPLRPPAAPGAPPGVAPRRPAPVKPTPRRPDVYAGKDGQVYTHRKDGWYRRDGPDWQKAEPRPSPQEARPQPPTARPRADRPSSSAGELDRQRQARIQGEKKAHQYRSMGQPRGRTGRTPAGDRKPHR